MTGRLDVGQSEQHVDLYGVDPISGTRRFISREPLDSFLLVKKDGTPTQVAQGRATYYAVSEPHTRADCPEAD